MDNYALYYPTIEFSNHTWLWNAALLWDRIYRIVPSDYEPMDCSNVRVLTESGEIGIPIHPDAYIADVAHEFIEKWQSGTWTAAALMDDISEDYVRLNKDKVDVKLREMIVAEGHGAAHEDWLYVPSGFGGLYMTYLANHVALSNNLQMLSDDTSGWTGSTYFRYDGSVEDFPLDEYAQQLAVLVVRDFLPQNLSSISPDEILKFREKYRDERQRFLKAIQESASELSKCEDPQIVRDHIEDIRRNIESSLKDYRKALEALHIVGLTGLKSLTFPVVTKVAAEIAGKELSASNLMLVSGLGVAVGLVSGLLDMNQKKRKLEKESDYSYLLHLKRNWKGCAMYDNDYNYYLCREMEEFIND